MKAILSTCFIKLVYNKFFTVVTYVFLLYNEVVVKFINYWRDNYETNIITNFNNCLLYRVQCTILDFVTNDPVKIFS